MQLVEDGHIRLWHLGELEPLPPLDLALSVLVANAKRSEIDAVHQAAAVVEAAHREGVLVALTPTQRVVDTRHPSCADDTGRTDRRWLTERGA